VRAVLDVLAVAELFERVVNVLAGDDSSRANLAGLDGLVADVLAGEVLAGSFDVSAAAAGRTLVAQSFRPWIPWLVAKQRTLHPFSRYATSGKVGAWKLGTTGFFAFVFPERSSWPRHCPFRPGPVAQAAMGQCFGDLIAGQTVLEPAAHVEIELVVIHKNLCDCFQSVLVMKSAENWCRSDALPDRMR
jgi:hypothetical protein